MLVPPPLGPRGAPPPLGAQGLPPLPLPPAFSARNAPPYGAPPPFGAPPQPFGAPLTQFGAPPPPLRAPPAPLQPLLPCEPVNIKPALPKPKPPPPKPAPMPVKLSLGAKSKLAKVFNADSSDEEEIPPEARMKMRNVGRDTATSSGPNSFGKTKKGFTDTAKLFERQLQEAMDAVSNDKFDRDRNTK